MKWNNNGIKYNRGCHECLIAQYDSKGPWWSLGACATQQTMKSEFKRLGEYLNASACEVKLLYDDNDVEAENNVVSFRFNYSGVLLVANDELQKYLPYTTDISQ